MAPRVFLLCILFTVGLLTGRSKGTAGLDVTLGFTQEPQDVVAVRSKPLVLQCAAYSTTPGPVNISWTHDGEPIPLVNDSRRHLLTNGSLYFKKVLWKRSGPTHEGSSDQGEYRCLARNSVGTLVSRSAHLRVANLSHDFTVSPYNMTVEEDDIARFTCQIESVPKALISWERNGKLLPQNSRFLILDSGVLYITKVQPSDAGTYRCLATNLLRKKSRVSSEGQLEVSPKSPIPRVPQFLSVASAMIDARVGENVTLDCAATGSPLPELTWMFLPRVPDNKLRPFTNATKTGVNVVTLHQVTSNHTGTYTCTASSVALEKQSASFTQSVSVEVKDLPTFEKVPASQVYFIAETIRLDCEVKDNKTVDIRWLKNGKELQINGRIKKRQSELVLSNTVTADSGLYQCMARNKVGESWAAAQLLVNMSRYQLEPPHGLVCYTLSDSQVRLEWKEPPKAENLTAYTVHYLATDGGEERQEVSVLCKYTVQKLLSFTNYTFYVRAYNSKSASDQSKRIMCQTGEGVPLAAPQISTQATSPTSLRVTWTPLSKEKAQGVVTEYKIQWRRKGQPSSRVEQVKGDITDFTITELHPGKKYQVRVLAATSRGWPNQPDEFEWKDEDMPNYGPQNVPQAPTVHLTVVNSTSIEVTWSLPPDNKWSLPPDNKYKPNGFRLYYSKLNHERVGPINLASNNTQYLLGNLDQDSLYEVFVQGYNNEGAGDFGSKAIHTFPVTGNEDLTTIPPPDFGLEPPTNLEAEPTSPTTINLTWTPPRSGTNVSYYTVCFSLVQSSPSVNTSEYHYVSSTSQGVEITQLKPYTLYEFKVRSHNHNNQYGPYSQKVECHTLEDVPSAVLDVQWRTLNLSTVRLSWKEPQYINGVIKNYAVTLKKGFGASQDVRSFNVSGSKLSTEVTDLEANTRYSVAIRAVTRAGKGPPSDSIIVTIPVVSKPVPPTDHHPPSQETDTDQHLGIVVGVAIGVGCIILCAIAIVWRRRCIKSASSECTVGGSVPTCGHHVNGNGYYREWDRSPHIMATCPSTEIHEMDYLTTTIASNIPCDSHADHLDTKGGYPNGQVNGLKHPLLTNGQATRDRSNVHIIENPQFNRGSADPQQKVLLPATKSRTSHSHSDRRSGAGGEEEEVRLLPDHNAPLLPLRGEKVEPSLGAAAENSSCNREGSGDDSIAEVHNITQVSSLDLSFDGDVLSEESSRSGHQNQQQLNNSQQHSPHYHHHHRHDHPSNSSQDSHNQGNTGLLHIDNITGTTTRSQFHSPLLLQESPSSSPSATTIAPQTELFEATASSRKDLLLSQ